MMSSRSIDDVFGEARALALEIGQFVSHVVAQHAASATPFLAVRAAALESEVRTEIKALERIVDRDQEEASKSHTEGPNSLAASSNMPFYAAVWDTAKRSRDLVAIRHKVSSPKSQPSQSGKTKRKSWTPANIILAPGPRVVPSPGESHKNPQLMVDIVADGGRTWWKISAITNRRLLFDLAKEGLYLDAGDEGGLVEALAEVDALVDVGEYGYIPLVKLAREYVHAASVHRIRGRPPTIHLVLPRIDEGAEVEVSLLVEACRRMGAEVHTAQLLQPAPALTSQLLESMAPNPVSAFTDVLNLDTSTMIALVSDFCHTDVKTEPWFSKSHRAHWQKEQSHKMMDELLPALQGHSMVCTEEAAVTFQHIVSTIGTLEENARATILLEGFQSSTSDLSHASDLVAAFQNLSIRRIPATLCLPIRPVTLTLELKARVPMAAQEVLARNPDMLQPGLSVFQYGWASGRTTITANLVAARTLGRDLELDSRLVDDADWPRVWVTSESRPLVGVPKAKRSRKHMVQCQGGCVCGIDRFHGGRTYSSEEEGKCDNFGAMEERYKTSDQIQDGAAAS